MKTIIISLATLTFTIGLGMAQTASELLTTVGTTVQVSGNHHAYVLWQPGDAGSTLGKRFAVYSKSGTADTAGSYTRHGIQTLQTSPNTIRALLELGETLDTATLPCNRMRPRPHRAMYHSTLLTNLPSSSNPP